MGRQKKSRWRRARLEAPEAMGDLLDRAGEDRFARRRSPIPTRHWKIAMGQRIAERAQPVSLERGTLLVKVTSSTWAHELQMLAPELMMRLRAQGYGVERIRFRVGALDSPERPPERRTTRIVPPPVELSPELTAVIANVPDDDLRRVIARAASANLAWQDFVAPVSGVPRSATAAANSEAPRGARVPRTFAGGPKARRTPTSDPGRRR
jgi:hypothetical protein